jgi:signal transduction histidine kinase
MSFCIYTVLFTLSDREPSKNEYVKIFQFWISQIIKTNSAKKVVVLIDNKLIDSVIRNLISNSIKFTNRNGLIKIKSEDMNDGTIVVSIEDTGVGMTQTQIDNIFNFFD